MTDRKLVQRLYAQMGAAWASEGSGTLEVGPHYVQWAKYDGGLQVECVSNAFLEPEHQLTEQQHRALERLGFSPPTDTWPNHYRRFRDESEIFDAAIALAAVVDGVLPFAQSSGGAHVCVVVPVAKCSRQVLDAQVGAMREALSSRTDVTVIHVLAWSEDVVTPDVAVWLDSQSVAAPDALQARVEEGQEEFGDLLRAIGRLKDLGRHVLIAGPPLLPGDRVYNATVNLVADGVISIGAWRDYELSVRECARLLTEERPTLAITYGKPGPRLPAEELHIDERETRFPIRASEALGLA